MRILFPHNIETVNVFFSESISSELVNITTTHEVIDAEAGDDVTLNCFFDAVKNGTFSVNWYKTTKLINGYPDLLNGATKIWVYHKSATNDNINNFAPVGKMPALVERNTDFPAAKGHSIRIKNITEKDEGTYVCLLEVDYLANYWMANIKVNFISEHKLV